jgi:hypothetical protein
MNMCVYHPLGEYNSLSNCEQKCTNISPPSPPPSPQPLKCITGETGNNIRDYGKFNNIINVETKIIDHPEYPVIPGPSKTCTQPSPGACTAAGLECFLANPGIIKIIALYVEMVHVYIQIQHQLLNKCGYNLYGGNRQKQNIQS